MTPETKRNIIKAIRSNLGQAEDNLTRAELAARHNPRDDEWGRSGQTLGQIIEGYERERALWRATLTEVEAL